ncbi:putative inactive leucine-rich repeat receptor-like protein kinase IMK2 [Sesamum angolense]|uniref:Inactive leucine-rich repeat receptor-like protein kinase IMK2 n=1 Tax=Sesamum angolense TaxID=2727404 RepID=A0AAE2BNV1_9LAMI|nr:putative inactive leucine-rich repeat receptor-like protein kinase IMK2 [Sesamum angolense]
MEILHCQLQEKADWSRSSNKKKENCWRLPHLFSCLFLLLFTNCQLVSGKTWDGVVVTQSDYQALKALKHEFVDSRGVLKSWNDSGVGAGACSGWAGIKCVNGQVIAIQLPWKGLGGRISEKIGQLQALRRISLHDNVLVGPVPTSLGFLPNLRGVYLFNNRLSGSIPPSIGPVPVSLSNSPSLTLLALQHNNLSGSVPDTWASLSKLTMLEELNLSQNQIKGDIPEGLGSLSRLKSIDISNNAINGSVPESLFKLSSLVTINLENNYLDGQIPESIEQLRNLSILDLSNNKFQGQIPGVIGNITSITFLDLSENNLTGEIPISLINLHNLSSFDVSFNNLSGAVPSVLARKFNSSSFTGNVQLCGYSSSTPCPAPGPEHNLPSPSQGAPKHHHRKLSTKDIILIAAGALLVVLLILCCVLLCCLIRRKASSKSRTAKAGGLASTTRGAKQFLLQGLKLSNRGLKPEEKIMGKSTYGTCYKATLDDSNQVAVKRLREKITKAQKEFELEVSELGKIRHPNILALRAYYLGPKGRSFLSMIICLMEVLPRGPETIIPWPTRMTIAIGITQGLCYLHNEENIVHGNLTSSNILLDEHNNPKIADVGLSRLMTSTASTNVIATAGTMGYRAPEFSKLKNASTKTDVFSLGVIILELLTGKSPSEATDGLDLPQWVASIVKEEWTNEVFDVELMRDASNICELLNTLKLALHCVDPSPAARPEAQQVVQKLEEIVKPEPGDVSTAPASGNDGAAPPPAS